MSAVLFLREESPALNVAGAPAPIQVALAEDDATPPTPTPPQPMPTPNPVKSVPHVHHAQPETVPEPLLASSPSVEPTENVVPASAASIEAPPVARFNGRIEDAYAASLRTQIDARTRPPDSVEYGLLKPHGEARVNFTLDRGGVVLDFALAKSSGSKILDRQALLIVQTTRYPAFPDNAYAGESKHSFLVTVEFHL